MYKGCTPDAQGCWDYRTVPDIAGCACTNIEIFEGAINGRQREGDVYLKGLISPLFVCRAPTVLFSAFQLALMFSSGFADVFF